ncbi:MAG: NHLP family bacteriocin export ABC transporter peptidase/permease/ATPase subunit [Treponema sp.]|nr:NHLP family bacteriocin export ABC transporter peptidase/permease/ATPase subunit [Candidatus Treponema merdequi]
MSSKFLSIFKRKKTKTPTVLQLEAVECGAASLAMILSYYGVFVPLEKLRIECGVSRDGTKASNIVKAARRYGLEAAGYKCEIENLKEINLPAIIFWEFNHFVVLEKVLKNKAIINDPAMGRRTIPMEDFNTSFTGVVLTFSPTAEFKKTGKKPSIFSSIKKRMKNTYKEILYIALTGILLLIPGIALPAYSRIFIDKILVGGMNGFLKPLLIAMFCTGVIQTILSYNQDVILMRFEQKLSIAAYSKFLTHLFKLPPVFFTQRMPGEICDRIESNDSIASFFSTKFASLCISLVAAVFYLAMMFSYDWILTCVVLAANLFNFLYFKIIAERLETGMFKNQVESAKLSGITMNGFQLIETIKANGSENDFFKKWSGQQAKVLQCSQKMQRLSIETGVAPGLVSQIISILILLLGVLRVIDGHLTIGMLIAFQSLQGGVSGPISEFVGLASELQTCKAELKRLDDVMEYPEEKKFKDEINETVEVNSTQKKYQPAVKLQGELEIKNLQFGYSILEKPFIDGLNIKLKPGMRVALVGSSGSGKSTIAKIISSLYKQWDGEVLYDGKAITEINRIDFCNSVSIVDQDIFLFEGNVKDNITMWNTAISENDYIRAAKDACIHDVIAARPEGYFSKVEEGGANFSGGQRQRLEIARALATNPAILIMDEATSALDAVTEYQVDQNIRKRNCTCVIVAHRLSTIRDADVIIVLDHGRVVQSGTHKQLIKQNGLYKDLIKTM